MLHLEVVDVLVGRRKDKPGGPLSSQNSSFLQQISRSESYLARPGIFQRLRTSGRS